jgi:hypothetical protein
MKWNAKKAVKKIAGICMRRDQKQNSESFSCVERKFSLVEKPD